MMRAVAVRRTAVVAVVVALALLVAFVVWRPSGPSDSAGPTPTSTSTSTTAQGAPVGDDPTPTSGGAPDGGDGVQPPGDPGPTPAGDGGAPVEPEVVAAIDEEGSTPVVVALDVPTDLTPEARAVAVAAAAEAVLAALPPGSYEGVKPTGTVPMLALAVDAAGLAALRDAAPVAAVGIDGLNEPFSVASIEAAEVDQAWERGATGTGGLVAVLDTGVEASHPYLSSDGVADVVAEACFSTNFSVVTSLCPDEASSAVGPGAAVPCSFSGCWHGTHVAGIAAGGLGADSLGSPTFASGVAPDAGIVAVKVFSRYPGASGPVPVAYDSDIARALEWLYAERDQHPGLAAVNLSLGNPEKGYAGNCDGVTSLGAVKTAIDDLRSVGIITVIASGNEYRRGAIAAPACLSSAVAVGAVDNSVPPEVAGFSNHGDQVELLAPGSGIRSSVPGSTMSSRSGTSMATPAVAGALATLAEVRPDLSAEDRLAVLATTGAPVTAAGITRPAIQLADAVDDLLDGRPWAPLSVAGTPGDGEVSLQWDPPADVGDGPIVRYEVVASPGGATCTALAATTCTVTGLTNGVAHRFAVRAVNSTGTGPAADSAPLVAVGRPGAPEGVQAVAGDTTVAVSWSPPSDDGGSPITGYQVTATPGGAGCVTTGATACVVEGLTNGQAYTVEVVAENAQGAGPPATSAGSVLPAPSAMVPLVPARLMDTRPVGPDVATVDGEFVGGGVVGQGEAGVRSFEVLDRGGVPASGVAAVALNVTVTGPTAWSDLRVFPTGSPVPNASNLNFVAGETVPNMVIAKVSADGEVSVFNAAGSTHVVVDVMGWFPEASSYRPLEPVRLMDTRAPATGIATIDGQAQNGGPVVAQPRTLQVAGRAGMPASGVGAVALNVTVTGPTAWSNLRVYPGGSDAPNASNLNFTAGQTVPNMVIAKVGPDGTVSIANAAGSTHVVVDVMGWFPAATGYAPLEPARLMDTRTGPDAATVDGQFAGTGAVTTSGPRPLTVAGRGGVPTSGVSAVALNVTAVGPTAFGNLRVFPAGSPMPNASNLNFVAGETVPNMVIAKVGVDGAVSIANAAGSTHVVVDVMGWFP